MQQGKEVTDHLRENSRVANKCDNFGEGYLYGRLRGIRALYEGHGEDLADYLYMPLPSWIADRPHKHNLQTVAKLSAQS